MRNRIVALDVLRGFMLLAMTFNHLNLLPFIQIDFLYHGVREYVHGPLGLFSNSEGFFFLAGMVCGIVYGKLLINNREAEIWPKVRSRLFQMYAVHILLLLGVVLLLTFSEQYLIGSKLHSTISNDPLGYRYFFDNPWECFAMGSVFLFLPPYFDILPVYIFFLAITPFVLRQLHQGRVLAVMSVSLTCWLVFQFLPAGLVETPLKEYLPVKLGWFNPFAGQIIFVSGLSFGFYYAKGIPVSMPKVYAAVGALALAAAALLLLDGQHLMQPKQLGLLRLLVFIAKASVAFLIANYCTSKSLAMLGRNSLLVFTYHLALVYALVYFIPAMTSFPMYLRILLMICSLLTIWIPPYLAERRQSLSTRLLQNRLPTAT